MPRIVPFFPTVSAFQMHEKLFGRVDSSVYRFRARNEWTGIRQEPEPLNDYMTMQRYPSKLVVEVAYERQKLKQPFNLEEVVEKANNAGAQDLYISSLSLLVPHGNGVANEWYAHFVNTRATDKSVLSDVTKLRMRYLKKHGLPMRYMTR